MSTRTNVKWTPWMIGCALALMGAPSGCGPRNDGSKPRLASLDSADWRSRVDKVDVLAEASSQETLALLLRALQDEHPRVREAAIKALARRQASSALASFVRAVKDPDEGVRLAAVAVLQQFTGEQVVSVVLLRLGAGSALERERVRAAVSAQLARSSGPARLAALRRLAIMAKAERPGTQEDAAAILQQVGPAVAEPVLEALAAAQPGSEGPWIERLDAVLGKLGQPAVGLLVQALRQAGTDERRAAVAARVLPRLGADAVPGLLDTLDPRQQHALEAADLAEEVLVRLGDAAVPGVTARLADPLEHRRLAAVELLQRLRRPAAVPALLAALDKETNRALRLATVRALGSTGDPRALPPVLAALRKDAAALRGKLDAEEWEAYREALVALRVPAKDLVPALKDPLAPLRLVAVQVATRLRLAEALGALPGLLRDREPYVLQAAAQAAGELGLKAATPTLRQLAVHKNQTVRLRAVVALGRLADPRAVGDLASAAGYKPSQAVMAAALLSLGQVGAKAGLAPARALRTKSSRVLRAAALATLARLEGQAAPTFPTLCGLLLDQKQLCAKEAPDKDVHLDLESGCGSAEVPQLEPLVRASSCRELQDALQRLAGARGSEVFTSTWGESPGRKREQVGFRAGVRQGPLQRWHASGKLQLRGTLSSGLRHGPFEAFWESGKRRLRATYVNDHPHGRLERWYPSGSRQEQGTFQNGVRHGSVTFWHPGGQKAAEQRHDQGKLEGKQLSFHPDGKPSSEAVFVKGKRHGAWTTWFPGGGKRSQGQYVEGLRHGDWTWFHPSGKLRETGSFERGQKTRVWTTFDAEGKPTERCDYSAAGGPRCGS